jgi:hypothetical protein
MVLVRSREGSTTQIDSDSNLSPLRHFTEHLVGVSEKLPPENKLDHESSSYLFWQLKRHNSISSCNNPYTRT